MHSDITFVIADNQDITRAGLHKYIFDTFGQCRITDVTDKNGLISTLTEYSKGVVILDYALFDLSDAEELLCLEKQFPRISWLLFSNEQNQDIVRRLNAQHTISMVLKENSGEEICFALKSAVYGERFLCRQITNLLLTCARKPEERSILTTTEVDILKLIAHGKSVKEIAVQRTSSIHTIITHKKNIFRKLEVNNVHEATKYALRAGLIEMVEYYI